MVLLVSGKVEVVRESSRVIRTVSQTFRIPAIVRLVKFIRTIYRREVPLSRKNIITRDGCTCRCSGTEYPPSELTIDHIIPRVQGGARPLDKYGNLMSRV